MSRQITLIAGQPQEFYEVGDFVRILAATDPLTIEFYSAGREIAEAVNVSKGYAEKFDLGTFDRVRPAWAMWCSTTRHPSETPRSCPACP